MSQENVEVVRRANEALNRHDWTAWSECFDADAVYYDQTAAPQVDMPPVLRGREALLNAMLGNVAALEDLHRKIEELIDAGEQVVSVGRWVGTGKASGARTEQLETIVWTVREGRLVEGRAFPSLEEALEAVGLRE